jgi:two-component system, LytTR family, response regulator
MSNVSAIIVDDERRSRELLKTLLQVTCPEVTVKALASNLDEAIQSIKEFLPDIVFLDIRLGNDFGFDLLPFLPEPKPAIIFTTAHEQYAIKALRSHAADYLMKPIVSDELKAAVERTIRNIPPKSKNDHSPLPSGKFAIATAEGSIFVTLTDIIRCEAKGAYTEIHRKNDKPVLTSINLGEIEKTLTDQAGFFRIHHSTIINLAEIDRYVKTNGGFVVMSDDSKVQISQRKKSQFTEIIKRFQKLG